MEKPAVPNAFDAVAPRYDLMCRLNPGYMGMLGDAARALAPLPSPRLLDLCCGSGLSTQALRRAHPGVPIVALDGSPGMLEQARRKPLAPIEFVQGDAQVPQDSLDGPFGGILMSYGLRNVADPDASLVQLRGLLAPGGLLAIHDYSLAGPGAERLWTFMCRAVVRPFCAAVSGAPQLFEYLERSVLDFDRRDALAARIRGAGFELLRVIPGRLWQRQIVHTFVARRPA
ncbi:MAG: class I SAM-dependent methyltransferase [Gammaproteobacteria bacterium]